MEYKHAQQMQTYCTRVLLRFPFQYRTDEFGSCNLKVWHGPPLAVPGGNGQNRRHQVCARVVPTAHRELPLLVN